MELTQILVLALKTSIALIVLGLGLNATWRDAFFLFRNPGLLLRSLLSMTVLMPLVTAAFVVAFDLPPGVKVALVALAVSPVPPLIPGKQMKAGGDEAYAIGLFFAIAALAIITVPLVIWLFTSALDREHAVSPLLIASPVLTSVLLPLAAGIVLRQWFPAMAARVARPVGLLGLVMLIIGVLPLLVALWPALRALLGNGTGLILAAMAVIGLGIGHALGGPQADRRTVLAISTSARHPAVALTVAIAVGAESKPALAAILLYLVIAAIVTIPYVMWRKRLSGATTVSQAAEV